MSTREEAERLLAKAERFLESSRHAWDGAIPLPERGEPPSALRHREELVYVVSALRASLSREDVLRSQLSEVTKERDEAIAEYRKVAHGYLEELRLVTVKATSDLAEANMRHAAEVEQLIAERDGARAVVEAARRIAMYRGGRTHHGTMFDPLVDDLRDALAAFDRSQHDRG